MAKTAAERQKRYRDNKRNAQRTESVTRVMVEQAPEHLQPVAAGSGVCVTVGLDDYLSRPEAYIPRREPDKLNWGPWMDVAGLEQAGLKANRAAIPGDWDYVGVSA